MHNIVFQIIYITIFIGHLTLRNTFTAVIPIPINLQFYRHLYLNIKEL